MLTITFDTHAAVKQLRAVGVSQTQAETLVNVITQATSGLATKADLEPLATKEFVNAQIAGVRTEIANLETRLLRQLWVVAVGIVASTFTLLKMFP